MKKFYFFIAVLFLFVASNLLAQTVKYNFDGHDMTIGETKNFGVEIDANGADSLVFCVWNHETQLGWAGVEVEPSLNVWQVYHVPNMTWIKVLSPNGDKINKVSFFIKYTALTAGWYTELKFYRFAFFYADGEIIGAGKEDIISFGIKEPQATEVEVDDSALPTEFTMSQNYPNPFNPSTTINYELPRTSEVQLKVFDAIGRVIKNLVSGQQHAGSHQVTWNGTDETGQSVPSGVYFYHITADGFNATRRMMLVK